MWYCLGVVFALAAIRFAPVLSSHFGDADRYLEHVGVVGRYDHIDAGAVLRLVDSRVAPFRSDAFPLASTPLRIWLFALTLAQVKIVQYSFVLCTFVTFGAIVRRILRSSSGAVACTVFVLCAWQFRSPHDPVIGTSFVSPWNAELCLLPFACWFRYRDSNARVWLVGSCATLAGALLSSPIAWGLGAVLALLATTSRRPRLASALVGTTLVVVAAVRFHDGVAFAPWHHAGSFVSNVANQLVAPLPASYRALGHLPVARIADLWHGTRFADDRFVFIPAITRFGWIVVLSCTIAAYAATSAWGAERARPRWIDGGVFAIALWLVPALCLGPENVWQRGLAAGDAFDGVYLQYFGVGLVIALCVRRALAGASAARLVPALASLAVFFASYGNARADDVALARSARLDEPRSRLERAGSAGLFRSVPEGARIAIAAQSPLYDGLRGDGTDARYAIYHYSDRRYRVVSEEAVRAGRIADAWVLRTSRAGIYVSLTHVTGRAGALFADRAYGAALPEWQSRSRIERGLAERVSPLRSGFLIAVRRLCGPVPIAETFEPSTPTLVWGGGFYPSGPVGYPPAPSPGTADSRDDGVSQVGLDTKMFMASRGELTIDPSTCEPGIVDLRAVVYARSVSELGVLSPEHVDRIPVSVLPTSFWLRYETKRRGPIHIRFSTKAPIADLDPVFFRYERDVRRDLRLVLQATSLTESPYPVSRRP
ncbi:MAG: hypothetical protein NVSMB21_04950 [Vulcanimicrobiaceae bacterium]